MIFFQFRLFIIIIGNAFWQVIVAIGHNYYYYLSKVYVYVVVHLLNIWNYTTLLFSNLLR